MSEENYVFYDSAVKCAAAAAPIFAKNRWHWHAIGVPNKQEILKTLRYLQVEGMKDGQRCETGRLVYDDGKYGHQRA